MREIKDLVQLLVGVMLIFPARWQLKVGYCSSCCGGGDSRLDQFPNQEMLGFFELFQNTAKSFNDSLVPKSSKGLSYSIFVCI